MSDPREVSRRGFVKAVGGLAGAAALPADAWARADGRGDRLPVARRLAGLERSRDGRAPRRDLRGGAHRRGFETSWRVTNLPSTADVIVRLNGQPFTRFDVTGPGEIRIDSTVDAHQFEIVTAY